MIIATAGFIIGVTLGYVVGSDNGFVKGCNWAYYNRDKKCEGGFIMGKFSQQHYIEVAKILQGHYAYVNYSKLVFDFKLLFLKDNEKFKEELFVAACIPKVLKKEEEPDHDLVYHDKKCEGGDD